MTSSSVPTIHRISQITWCLISAKPVSSHFLFISSYFLPKFTKASNNNNYKCADEGYGSAVC